MGPGLGLVANEGHGLGGLELAALFLRSDRFARLAHPVGDRQFRGAFLAEKCFSKGRVLPGVLAAEALVVAESDRRAPLELTMPAIDERRYGDTLIRLHAS